jgi:multidrug efflux pump subunit AcrB
MNDKQYDVYQALVRASEFGIKYAAQFPATSLAKANFARVPALLTEIAPADSLPGTPASPATERKQALLDEVWEDLRAIARTARAIAKKEPGFDIAYRLGDDSHRAIRDTATAVLARLQDAPTAAKFLAYDMPADFVTDLQADLAQISSDTLDQAADLRDAVGGTARVRELIQEGRELIRALDASVKNRFRDDPSLLAEWQTASHIRRRNRKAEEDQPTPVRPTL